MRREQDGNFWYTLLMVLGLITVTLISVMYTEERLRNTENDLYHATNRVRFLEKELDHWKSRALQ